MTFAPLVGSLLRAAFPRSSMRHAFRRFASWSSDVVGSAPAFLASLIFCVAWAASGPLFRFSDTWQLVVNTVTSIITFLMVFLIQYSQNRDTQAMQLKLDELLRVVEGTRPHLMRVEESSDEERNRLESEMRRAREASNIRR
jgi:low affinity Fe/Cu permease